MKIHRIRSLEEFRQHHLRTQRESQSLRSFERSFEGGAAEFTVQGYSYPAGKEVAFLVDYLYSTPGKINWRERVVCPITGLNNRLRASIHLLDVEISPYADDRIFLSEQVTPLYSYLKPLYLNLVGSEYLGSHKAPGEIDSRGVRHEDFTSLSFEDGTLDCILSFDCFEHFPNFEVAFRECSRVLKPQGKILWSVPFIASQQNNTIRAKIVNGEIQHLLAPEYHGDPLNQEGCLCFTHFGWEMLQQVKGSGFRECYAIAYSSREYGYLGGDQLVFVAHK